MLALFLVSWDDTSAGGDAFDEVRSASLGAGKKTGGKNAGGNEIDGKRKKTEEMHK